MNTLDKATEHSPSHTDGEAGSRLDDIRVQQGNASEAPWYIGPFKLFIKLMLRLVFRIRVIGLENVPHEPAIICSNHLGWSEMFLIMGLFPTEPRIYVLGEKQVALISNFRHRMITALQIMVPLDRSKPVQAVRIMEDVLKRGGSLLIFPEGKLGTQEGALLDLQAGASHLSLTSGHPLLPVGLTGTSQLWLRRTLTMRIGKPIRPAEFGDTTQSVHTRTRQMNVQLAAEMRSLLPGDFQRARFKPLRKWLTELF